MELTEAEEIKKMWHRRIISKKTLSFNSQESQWCDHSPGLHILNAAGIAFSPQDSCGGGWTPVSCFSVLKDDAAKVLN